MKTSPANEHPGQRRRRERCCSRCQSRDSPAAPERTMLEQIPTAQCCAGPRARAGGSFPKDLPPMEGPGWRRFSPKDCSLGEDSQWSREKGRGRSSREKLLRPDCRPQPPRAAWGGGREGAQQSLSRGGADVSFSGFGSLFLTIQMYFNRWSPFCQ